MSFTPLKLCLLKLPLCTKHRDDIPGLKTLYMHLFSL